MALAKKVLDQQNQNVAIAESSEDVFAQVRAMMRNIGLHDAEFTQAQSTLRTRLANWVHLISLVQQNPDMQDRLIATGSTTSAKLKKLMSMAKKAQTEHAKLAQSTSRLDAQIQAQLGDLQDMAF